MAQYLNPYWVAVSHHVGELTYKELLAIIGLWPHAETTDADEDVLDLEASPGSFAHVEWALRHELITDVDYRRIAELAADHYGAEHNVVSVYDLTAQREGRWRVSTKHSIHIIDLDEGTVTRIPGPAALTWPGGACTYRLRTFNQCRTRESGHWTMHPTNIMVAHHWASTTAISTIVRIDAHGHPVPRS